MGEIVCGFVGTGKSSILKYCEGVKSIDLDTAYFKKIPGWENVYAQCAIALTKMYDIVCITSYAQVMRLLNKHNIKWWLVYPDRSLKLEYRERAIERGVSETFINAFFKDWDSHIDDAQNITNPNKIVLKSGQYISTVIHKILRRR